VLKFTKINKPKEAAVNLRIPGPTPCPEDVLLAGASPMINHRSVEFKDLIYRSTEKLQRIFQTSNEILILTTAGTGAMESAVVNLFSPGDSVLAVSIGSFGERFTQLAEAYGVQVVPLKYQPGTAADAQTVANAIQQNPNIKAVLITHNETSTGVTNPLESISRVVKAAGKLIVVDAVSSIGSLPLLVDEWECDIVLTASQKGWMTPPGLAMVSVSKKAWEANAHAKMPRFYFDYARARKFLQNGETPWTPAVSILFSLDLALTKMLDEGMVNVYSRHVRLAQKVRDGIKELGLELFADERYASDTVTAVKVPVGIDGKKLVETLRIDHDLVVAGGQEALSGKIFRVGHMGYVSDKDIDHCLLALSNVLPKFGF
jgi:aspartate aminotransferase-like enzyme